MRNTYIGQFGIGLLSCFLVTNEIKVLTLAVASYMEKRADELGALFSKARARFDYEGLKDTYRNCFL